MADPWKRDLSQISDRAKELVAEMERVYCGPSEPRHVVREVGEWRDILNMAAERIAALERDSEEQQGAHDDALTRWHDAVAKIHIALGGDGEWKAHAGPQPPIEESGHLHLACVAMAERLRAENAALLHDLTESADDLDGVDCMRDWPANAVLGESGVEGIDCALSARDRIMARLSNYSDVADSYLAAHEHRQAEARERVRQRLAAKRAAEAKR